MEREKEKCISCCSAVHSISVFLTNWLSFQLIINIKKQQRISKSFLISCFIQYKNKWQNNSISVQLHHIVNHAQISKDKSLEKTEKQETKRRKNGVGSGGWGVNIETGGWVHIHTYSHQKWEYSLCSNAANVCFNPAKRTTTQIRDRKSADRMKAG